MFPPLTCRVARSEWNECAVQRRVEFTGGLLAPATSERRGERAHYCGDDGADRQIVGLSPRRRRSPLSVRRDFLCLIRTDGHVGFVHAPFDEPRLIDYLTLISALSELRSCIV